MRFAWSPSLVNAWRTSLSTAAIGRLERPPTLQTPVRSVSGELVKAPVEMREVLGVQERRPVSGSTRSEEMLRRLPQVVLDFGRRHVGPRPHRSQTGGVDELRPA